MIKFKKPDNAYDRELAAKGLMRSQKLEVVQVGDGLASVYREIIIPIPTPESRKEPPRKEPTRVVKSARKGTKLSDVVDLVSKSSNSSKELLISDIMNMLGVTRSNASVYLSKAMKLI